jgi:hypothetical protein
MPYGNVLVTTGLRFVLVRSRAQRLDARRAAKAHVGVVRTLLVLPERRRRSKLALTLIAPIERQRAVSVVDVPNQVAASSIGASALLALEARGRSVQMHAVHVSGVVERSSENQMTRNALPRTLSSSRTRTVVVVVVIVIVIVIVIVVVIVIVIVIVVVVVGNRIVRRIGKSSFQTIHR